MPRNQNQARSSESPEQTKNSNDTGYTTLKRVFGQGAGNRNEILTGPNGNKNTVKWYRNIKRKIKKTESGYQMHRNPSKKWHIPYQRCKQTRDLTALSQNPKEHMPSQ